MDALLGKPGDVGRGLDARLTHEHARFIDEVNKPQGMADIGNHGPQVAVVDAQQAVGRVREPDVRADAEEIVHIVDFDEDGQLELLGEDHQVHQFRLGETFSDEQDGVSPGSPAFPELPAVDDEVLAEDGQGHDCLDAFDVGEVPAEEMLICEAGDGRGTAGVVALGDELRTKTIASVLGTDQTGGRALAFNLGDDRGGARFRVPGDRPEKVAWRLGLGDQSFKTTHGDAGFGFIYLGPLGFDDLPEDRGWIRAVVCIHVHCAHCCLLLGCQRSGRRGIGR